MICVADWLNLGSDSRLINHRGHLPTTSGAGSLVPDKAEMVVDFDHRDLSKIYFCSLLINRRGARLCL